jgi:hypothetical protein
MLINYLKVTMRSMLRNETYNFLNVVGLAVEMGLLGCGKLIAVALYLFLTNLKIA